MMDDDIVTNVLLVYQYNQYTIALVTGNGRSMCNRYMKVHLEYVKERLATSEVFMNTTILVTC
jgi:hypothetical protein